MDCVCIDSMYVQSVSEGFFNVKKKKKIMEITITATVAKV